MNTTHLKAALATAVSAVGLAMAAAAATERGATDIDRALIIAVACVLALGTHLLPALSRNAVAWSLWGACLIATAWNHASFFAGAASRAGQARADAVRDSGRSKALQAELDQIAARPLATVATDLGAARSKAEAAQVSARCDTAKAACRRLVAASAAAKAKVDALAEELQQARHAADLRTQITTDAGDRDAERSAASQDQVAATLARLTGLPPELLTTGMSVLSSLIVELLAALLWSEAIRGSSSKEAAESDRTRKPRSERVIGVATANKPGKAISAPSSKWFSNKETFARSLDAALRTIRLMRARDRPTTDAQTPFRNMERTTP